MPRFHKVMGVPGRLMPDPRALYASPARYVGMRHMPRPEDVVETRKKHEQYEPVEQVVPDDPPGHFQAAAANGDIRLLGTCVAETMTQAFAVKAVTEQEVE
jgi:hypothetical protein